MAFDSRPHHSEKTLFKPSLNDELQKTRARRQNKIIGTSILNFELSLMDIYFNYKLVI